MPITNYDHLSQTWSEKDVEGLGCGMSPKMKVTWCLALASMQSDGRASGLTLEFLLTLCHVDRWCPRETTSFLEGALSACAWVAGVCRMLGCRIIQTIQSFLSTRTRGLPSSTSYKACLSNHPAPTSSFLCSPKSSSVWSGVACSSLQINQYD